MRHSEQGFTMIELMVVVSILAILTAIAAPSFKGLIESWRVKQEVEGLQSAIFYARSEAIKRGGGVVLQKIANTTDGCTLASSNAALTRPVSKPSADCSISVGLFITASSSITEATVSTLAAICSTNCLSARLGTSPVSST